MSRAAGNISFRVLVAILSITAFLMVSQGAVTNSLAAEWELWPKGRGITGPEGEPIQKTEPPAAKPETPPAKPETPAAKAAAKAGEDAGKTVAAGTTTGTIGKVALIGAGLLAIGLAVGGGGGGGTTSPTSCPQ